MQTYLLHGAKDLRREEKPEPALESGQVLIRTKFTGICGSDVHYYKHGYCGRFVPKRPFALGHEFSGVIARVGDGVTTLKEGDAVAIDPSMPCGTCDYCRGGLYNLCTAMRFLGSASCDPHIDGGLGEYVAMPARNCFALPPGISLSQAALLEPLCVAMHAVRLVDEIAGRRVLVTGGGPIGQLVLRVARAFGALHVCVSDLDPFARESAMQGGADAVLDPAAGDAGKDGPGFDVVFEASGAPPALAAGLELIARGGTLVQIGTLPEAVTIPANLIMTKQLKVLGSFRYANVFEPAIAMVAAGKINLDGMVSATYGFDDIPTAMERALSKDRVVKVQIVQ